MNHVIAPADPSTIRSMFGAIARRYDLANTVLSFGLHHLWRKRLISLARPIPGDVVLDCATGTGDLAIAFRDHVGLSGTVIGSDFCAEMLNEAAPKARKRAFNVVFEQADVLHLPYADGTFDISSIAFGIRNVSHPQRALEEMARVTKPNGQVLILEFGEPKIPVWKHLYGFYSRVLLPIIGGMITGNTKAYRYLQRSARAFPCREDFLKLMLSTNRLQHVEYHSLCGGIAYVYRGRSVSIHKS